MARHSTARQVSAAMRHPAHAPNTRLLEAAESPGVCLVESLSIAGVLGRLTGWTVGGWCCLHCALLMFPPTPLLTLTNMPSHIRSKECLWNSTSTSPQLTALPDASCCRFLMTAAAAAAAAPASCVAASMAASTSTPARVRSETKPGSAATVKLPKGMTGSPAACCFCFCFPGCCCGCCGSCGAAPPAAAAAASWGSSSAHLLANLQRSNASRGAFLRPALATRDANLMCSGRGQLHG